jgi:hypothetical protein
VFGNVIGRAYRVAANTCENQPMAWRALVAVGLLGITLACGDGKSWSRVSSRCGRVTPIDQSAPIGRATPLGHVLWLAVYPFAAGHPTKAIAMAQRRLRKPVVIRGWDCANGSRLRFWYRNGLPFSGVPVSSARLRRTGTFSASFGPWQPRASRGGYLMYWHGGAWKLGAYSGGRAIGTAVVLALSTQ